MSKITATFNELKAAGKKGLIPFITAGDPDPGLTVELMHALVRGGSSVIELGVPFSDPMADGPVIQRASERALSHGVTLHSCLEMVKEFRKKDPKTPVVLMGYANPVEQMGADRFATEAKAALTRLILSRPMSMPTGCAVSRCLSHASRLGNNAGAWCAVLNV